MLHTLDGPPPGLDPAPEVAPVATWQVVRGVIHCHSAPRSHDATGSLQRVASAARRCEVGFVLLSDHSRRGQRTLRGGTPGSIDGVLFLPGVELSGGGGSILGLDLPPGFEPPARQGVAPELIAAVHEAGGLVAIAHAEQYLPWEVGGWDVLEVANLHAMATRASRLGTLAAGLCYPPGAFVRRLTQGLDPDVLARWDSLGRERRVPGFGGCDAHEGVRLFGRLGGRIGAYEECFRALNTHLLLRERSPAGVREALAAGRGYVAFEVEGAASGFRFVACDARGAVVAEMGEELPWAPGLELRAAAPGGARLRLLRDGALAAEGAGTLIARVEGPGVYRVEAWLEDEPFVLSNPIYVRAGH